MGIHVIVNNTFTMLHDILHFHSSLDDVKWLQQKSLWPNEWDRGWIHKDFLMVYFIQWQYKQTWYSYKEINTH